MHGVNNCQLPSDVKNNIYENQLKDYKTLFI